MASVTLDKEIMAFGEFKFGFFAFSSLVFISGIIGAVLSGWSLWLLLFVPLSFLGLVSGYFAGGLAPCSGAVSEDFVLTKTEWEMNSFR